MNIVRYKVWAEKTRVDFAAFSPKIRARVKELFKLNLERIEQKSWKSRKVKANLQIWREFEQKIPFYLSEKWKQNVSKEISMQENIHLRAKLLNKWAKNQTTWLWTSESSRHEFISKCIKNQMKSRADKGQHNDKLEKKNLLCESPEQTTQSKTMLKQKNCYFI